MRIPSSQEARNRNKQAQKNYWEKCQKIERMMVSVQILNAQQNVSLCPKVIIK